MVRGQHPLHAFTPLTPQQAHWQIQCSWNRDTSREAAKPGTHHRSRGHTTEAGDTPPKTGTHHHEADCRLQTASKSRQARRSPRISRLRFRSRLRVFASSREPNSPQRPPLHALRGRGYRGGTGDTAPGIPPPTSHAGFSHAQKIAIPHAKSRSAKWGTHHCEARSGGHSTWNQHRDVSLSTTDAD